MNVDAFAELALRVIAREATDEERRALETELASNPAHREEFEQLKLTHEILRTVAPMTEASQAKEPELPAYRLNELRTAVCRHFGPAAQRETAARHRGWRGLALWRLGGAGLVTALAVVIVLTSLSDRTVEIGAYAVDLVRNGEKPLSPADVPSARLVTFAYDAPFDQWKKTLSWRQHAKIWVDNENDLLHIVRRDAQGHIVEQTEPLAATNEEQRDQIGRAVELLQKR